MTVDPYSITIRASQQTLQCHFTDRLTSINAAAAAAAVATRHFDVIHPSMTADHLAAVADNKPLQLR